MKRPRFQAKGLKIQIAQRKRMFNLQPPQIFFFFLNNCCLLKFVGEFRKLQKWRNTKKVGFLKHAAFIVHSKI